MRKLCFAILGLVFCFTSHAQSISPSGTVSINILVSESSNGSNNFSFSAENAADLGDGGGATTIIVEVPALSTSYLFVGKSSSGPWGSQATFDTDENGDIASATVYVKFTPNYRGLKSIQISLREQDDVCSASKSVSLRGIAPEIQVSGNSVSITDGDDTPSSSDHTTFGTIDLGSYQERTYTITNVAGTTANDGDLKLTGDPRVVIGGANSSEFTVQTQPSTPIARNNNTTTFVVRFTPAGSGTRNATVSVNNNDLDENPFNFSISGQGRMPNIEIRGNNNIISDGDASPSSFDFTDFGSTDVQLGSALHTFYIYNTGEVNLTLTDHNAPNGVYVWIDGEHASDFSVNLQPASAISASNSDDFSLSFNPLENGIHTAIVHVASNDPDTPDYDFTITGVGVTPEIDISGNSVSISNGDNSPYSDDFTDFGGTSPDGGNIIRVFTISNQITGSYDGGLTLSGSSPYISISGTHAADFTVSSAPSSPISSGSSSDFQITFDPSGDGLRSATITINSNDIDESTYTFSIQGFGSSLPIVSTNVVQTITSNSASSGGNITSDGNSAITERGVCWSNSIDPNLSGDHSSNGTGMGSYSSNLSGLNSETFYYVRAFATNNLGTSYGNNQTFWTLSTEPANHPSDLTATNITNSEVDLNWVEPGDADGYIILMKSGLTAPVATGVSDGTEQSFFNLPSGTTVAAEVVGINTVTVSGLTGNQDYSFAIIAYARGTQDETYNYKTGGSLETVSVKTIKSAPSVQASNINFTDVQESQMTINWTRGNGDSCLVVVREAFAVNSNPVNFNTYYTGTSVFDDGSQLGTGNYVVYKGTGTSTTIQGLDGSTTYFVRLYEYNNGGANAIYATSTASANPASRATIKPVPTSQASEIVFSNIDATAITLTWTRGNGDDVLVIGSVGNNLIDPVTGTDYTANSTFGSGNTTGDNCYVLYKGNSNTISITGLLPETNYYFKVCEFNNPGTIYQRYNISVASNNPNNATTIKSEPSTQASDIFISNLTSGSASATWTRGNGEYTMLIAREGGSVSNPAQNTSYIANAIFGAGSQIGSSGTYVLYNGNDLNPTVNISGLKPNRTYYLKSCEYNNYGTVFLKYNTEETSDNPISFTTNNEVPAIQATNLSFTSVNFNSALISWANGDGQRRVVLVNDTSAVDQVPLDGTNYSASSTFGLGDELGDGNFIVYDGVGNSVSLTGLTASITYFVKVFEYNGTGFNTLYNISDSTNNPSSFNTLKNAPTIQAYDLVFSNVTTDSITLNWTRGNGEYCLILAKNGSAVDSNPANGSLYTANSSFGSGSQLGTGNFVVYKGTQSTVQLSGFTGNTTYHFKVFEFNNNTLGSTRYLISDAVSNPGSQTTENGPPTIQASNLVFSNIEETSYTVSCTKGNGQNRIFVLNSVNSFTNPTNGNDLEANSDWLNNGEQVIYNGTGNSVDITSLTANTTYYVRVYEFNNTGIATLYNSNVATNNPLSSSTLKVAPTIQASSLVFFSLTANSLQLNWTTGNGDSRIVIMNSENTFTDPTDGTSPTADNSWNGAGEQVVFNGSGSGLTVSGLESGNTYWFRVFEFNNTGINTKFLFETAVQNPNSQQTIGTVTWLGGSSGNENNWNTAANWSNGNVPTASVNVVINTSSYKPTVSSSAVCNNLTIDPGCFLLVENGATITINSALTIECNTSGVSGQIKVSGTGVLTANSTRINFYLIGTDYKLVSSPVSGATIGNTFSGFYVKKFTEATSWSAASSSNAMTAMKAFGVKYYNTRTTSFNGTLNNGTYSATVSASGVTEDRGWNLVGNPFISAIDWKASSGWDKSGIDNTVYIHLSDGQYATFNGTTNASTNGGSRYIAPMQGFFVHRSSVGSSSISMNNNVRVAVSRDFLKNEEDVDPVDLIKLELSDDIAANETAILFYPGAEDEFDPDLDALKLMEEENRNLYLFSVLKSGQWMDINTLPMFTENTSIPIGFCVPMAGTYSLSLKSSSLAANRNVILEDVLEGESVNLCENRTYTFNSNSCTFNNRFILHVVNSSLNINSDNEIPVNIFAFDKSIRIIDNQANNNAEIFVYDVLGKLLEYKKLNGHLNYSFDGLNVGTYLVKYQTDKKVISKKLIIY